MAGLVASMNRVADFGKNRNEIDELQRGEDFRTITFVVKWTPSSFQCSNGSIAIQTDCQSVTERTRRFQTTHMTHMQQIETSVRDDQFFPRAAEPSCALSQFIHIDDFRVHRLLITN